MFQKVLTQRAKLGHVKLVLTPRAYEFACHSKACAPPPAGSGGSKTGGSAKGGQTKAEPTKGSGAPTKPAPPAPEMARRAVTIFKGGVAVGDAVRIARIAQNRKDIAGDKTLAESDHLDGHPRGMMAVPPPKGLTQIHLSDDHLASLLAYRGEDYNLINGSLRFGVDLGANASATRTVINRMDQVFNMTRPTKEDIVVYRVMGMGIKDKIHDRGFVSTAYDLKVAQGFKGYTDAKVSDFPIIKIIIPKGSHAVKLSDEFGKGESEILLPRGANFHVQPDGSYRYMGSTEDPLG